MKKWSKLLCLILMVSVLRLQAVEANSDDIKDNFIFSSHHSFDIVKDDAKAEDKLKELKKTFDGVEDVEIKLEKTGAEGLDIFMAYYTGEQAEALDEIGWNIHDPFYENYWNDLVADLKLISREIAEDVGVFYGVGITINVSGEGDLLLLVTDGYVMEDTINAVNYDPDYINLFR